MSAFAPAAASPPAGAEDVVLGVDGLTVRYGNVVALNDVSFSIPRGAVTGLIGPNGAGKTTLIDALSNYTRASSGSVVFEGVSTHSVRAHRLARRGLIRTFQSVELFDDLTVEENLAVAAQPPSLLAALGSTFAGRRETRHEDVEWALTVTELHDVVDRYPTELSHGQRKLVGVGRALARRPSLLLLDEPAAGLDTAETLALGQRLRTLPDHGVTVLLIDHDMGLVLGTCDHVMVLDFGNLIASGTPAEIRADRRVVDAYLGSSHTEAADE
ncbi:MAG TPA: ABC transporter ATP-binding protein [Solirubrobacteraceae bacterium]|jgi:branched-chain amino acid transport system ATP-binding protein